MVKIGIGILSWRSPQTLAATLENYAGHHLFDLFDEARVFFQEINAEDRAIGQEYGLEIDGSRSNLGIEGGVRALVEGTSTYLLLLENDCPLVVDHW